MAKFLLIVFLILPETLSAFTHFVREKTENEILIDIPYFNSPEKDVFSIPAVFVTPTTSPLPHQCNHICQKLDLPLENSK